MWVSLNKEEYIKLNILLKEKSILFDTFLYLFEGKTGITRYIRSGSFVLSESIKEKIENYYNCLMDVTSKDDTMFSLLNYKAFKTAFAICFRQEAYDHGRFLKLLERQYGCFKGPQSQRAYLTLIEEIHNAGIRKPENRIGSKAL
jgi:hypothetical protein